MKAERAYARGHAAGKREGIEAAAQWLTDEDCSPGVADDMRSALLQTEEKKETGEGNRDGAFSFHCSRCNKTGLITWPDRVIRPCHVCRPKAYETLRNHDEARAETGESRAEWDNARERLLHGLYHIRDLECGEDHDESGKPCPRRIAKEAIDNRPCSVCDHEKGSS
jgi:hypothetical protein